MTLYRQEVLQQAQRPRLQGDVLLLPRIHHLWLTLSVLLWVSLVVLFLTQASYSRRETVRGFLQPPTGVVRIYPQGDGRLVRLLVSEGERVEQGQALAVVNGDRVLASGAQLQQILLQEYREQQAALEAELHRADDLAAMREADIRQQLEATGRELNWLDSQLDTRQLQLKLESGRMERYQALQANGHVTDSEVDQLKAQQLEKTLARQELAARRERLLTQRLQLQARLTALPSQHATDIDKLRRQLSALFQEIARLQSDRAHVIVSSTAGTVASVHLKPGQQAHQQLPLLSLLPGDPELVATLLVPVRAAGFVEAGQTLHLRYDAFPYQSFGSYVGHITAVESTVSLPGERLHQPLDPSEPVYRITADLVQQSITGHGRQVQLKAGMTFAADIKLQERSLWQWLLEPLHSIRGRLQ